MIRKRIPAVICILFPVLLYGASPRIIEINTRHFAITYPAELSAAAIDISCRAETVITLFINFMQYEPSGRIPLRITAPENTGIDSGNLLSLDSPGTIEVEAIDDPGSGLNLPAVIFDRYMKLFSDNFSGVPGITDAMISGLMDYIVRGIDDESVMLLNDYVLNLRNGEITINEGCYGYDNPPGFMSRFFWDYLAVSYGKDAAALSLKDAAYSGGFFNSLCRVTGKDIPAISEGFRLYLKNYLQPGKPEIYDVMTGFDDLSYTAISHCCSLAGDFYALLAERKGDYYLLSASDEKELFSAVKLEYDGIKFTSIAPSGENFVISGYDKYRSVLLCCDRTGREIHWEREFPFIYINHIHSDKTGVGIIFSAEVKGQASLFLYDMKSVVLLKTDNDGIDLLYPSLTASGNILYVRRDNVQSLMLLDAATGSVMEIYRTSNTIGRPVEDSRGRIIFSESVKGVTDIRCIDRSAGTFEQITRTSTSNTFPLVMKGRLIFLNFFKGVYRPVSYPLYLK